MIKILSILHKNFVLSYLLLLLFIGAVIFAVKLTHLKHKENKITKCLEVFVNHLHSCDFSDRYEVNDNDILQTDSFYFERHNIDPDQKYISFLEFPEVYDTCYWMPHKCDYMPRVTFINEYNMLINKGLIYSPYFQEKILTFDSNTIYKVYKEACPYLRFPCLDISEADLLHNVYKIICFHKYRYCYLAVNDEPIIYIEKNGSSGHNKLEE